MAFSVCRRPLYTFFILVGLHVHLLAQGNVPPPTVQNSPVYCQGSVAPSLTATPSPGGTLKWYGSNAAGGTASSVAPVPQTALAGTINYYVSQVVNGSESTRSSIAVTVQPLPPPPPTSTVSYSQYAQANPLVATGQNLQWYTNPSGGTSSIVPFVPSTSVIGTTTYYVSQTVQGCESPRSGLTVAVTAPPSTIAITNISNTTLCAGSIIAVSYAATGPAATPNTAVEVWLSDANSSFANQRKIGSGTSSPISVTLSTAYNSILPYGSNYRLKVVAPVYNAQSSSSSSVVIGSLGSISVFDRLTEVNNNVSSGTFCVGSQATLKAANPYSLNYLYPPGPIDSYQWKKDGVAIAGATSSTVSVQQAGLYTVVATQAGCSITSSTYTLSTTSDLGGLIYSLPSAPPQCDDHPLKLFSYYIGETAAFQWTRDGADISGATSYTYDATQTGTYAYRMTDGSCTFTAKDAYIPFGRSLNASISLNWSSDTLSCSNDVYATIVTTNNSYPYGYSSQLYRDGVLVNGNTMNSYSVGQPGVYTILVKQGSCETRSNALVFTKATQLKPRIIQRYFNYKSVCLGEPRYLIATPADNASAQWQRDGVDIPGATGIEYGATASGKYTVRVTQGGCTATSDPISLTFSNAPVPTIHAPALESCSGVDMNGNDEYLLDGYHYQWYRDGLPVNGAISSSFRATQSGAYSLRLTNGSCSGESKAVYATVNNGITAKPVITSFSKIQPLCEGNSLRLIANSCYGTVQWKRNGIPIPGATQIALYATQSGMYTVANQDGTCSAESDPVKVEIGGATTATLSSNALITGGKSALLPISFTGPAPWSALLTSGQLVTATYQNPAFITVSPTSNTTYQLASVMNACGVGSVSGQASVSVGTGSADVSANMTVSNRAPRVGELVAFNVLLSNAGPQESVRVRASCVLPPGLEFVDAPSIGLSFVNGTILADVGTISINGSIGFQFRARAIQPGVFVTALQITGTQTPDPDSQPNSGTQDGQDDVAIVDVRTIDSNGTLTMSPNPNQVPLPKVSGNQPVADANAADLSLAMQVSKLTPIPNELVTASLTVSNRGGSSAASVVVQVVLPNGTFSSQSPAGWILVSGQTYKRYINALPAGQSATVSLLWQPTGSGILKAQILDTDTPDPDSTPGNGYDNGEDDEVSLSLRILN